MNINDIFGQANYPIVIWLNHNLKKKIKKIQLLYFDFLKFGLK